MKETNARVTSLAALLAVAVLALAGVSLAGNGKGHGKGDKSGNAAHDDVSELFPVSVRVRREAVRPAQGRRVPQRPQDALAASAGSPRAPTARRHTRRLLTTFFGPAARSLPGRLPSRWARPRKPILSPPGIPKGQVSSRRRDTAANAPGSAFNENGGTAGSVYAGNGENTETPANGHAVSQYDVACYQVSQHH